MLHLSRGKRLLETIFHNKSVLLFVSVGNDQCQRFFFRSNVVALSLRTRVRKCHISIPRTSYCNGYSHVILKARVNSLSHKRILK